MLKTEFIMKMLELGAKLEATENTTEKYFIEKEALELYKLHTEYLLETLKTK